MDDEASVKKRTSVAVFGEPSEGRGLSLAKFGNSRLGGTQTVVGHQEAELLLTWEVSRLLPLPLSRIIWKLKLWNWHSSPPHASYLAACSPAQKAQRQGGEEWRVGRSCAAVEIKPKERLWSQRQANDLLVVVSIEKKKVQAFWNQIGISQTSPKVYFLYFLCHHHLSLKPYLDAGCCEVGSLSEADAS